MKRYNNICFKIFITFAVLTLLLSSVLITNVIKPQPAFAAEFIFRVNQDVYVPGDSLVVYGKGEPNDVFVIRLYDPAGRAIKIDNVPADKDGFFRQDIFDWPEPSKNLAFGSYTIEAISSIKTTNKQQIDVSFADDVVQDPTTKDFFAVPHILDVKLDSPDQIRVGNPFRIFIQVTYDGALVNADPAALLGSSHIHSGNSTINLSDDFVKLHEGLYYADVTIDKEGAYIIHAMAFYHGLLSHDSKVVSATNTTINSVQDSVNLLDKRLTATTDELNKVQQQLDQTKSTLNETRSAITRSIEDARKSLLADVERIEQASGQLNSIILPVLALISVILALQISLFARIRASYR